MVAILRRGVEAIYPLYREVLFLLDPEKSHSFFTSQARVMNKLGLDKLLLEDDSLSAADDNLEISTAAGFDKYGLIPAETIKYLGYDRHVIGSIMPKPRSGNPKPRIWRLPKLKSLINRMGLPFGEAEPVFRRIYSNFKDSGLPLTINVAPAPDDEHLSIRMDNVKKLMGRYSFLKLFASGVSDRIQYNVSCPNTSHDPKAYVSDLRGQLEEIEPLVRKLVDRYGVRFELKVSPDATRKEVNSTLDVLKDFKWARTILVGNTSLDYDDKELGHKGEHGGLSGKKLQSRTVQTIERFYNRIKFIDSKNEEGFIIRGCGGYNTREKVSNSRMNFGVEEFESYSGLIYDGPGHVRELKGL